MSAILDPGPVLPSAVTDQAGARSPWESLGLVVVLAVLTVAAIALVRRRRMRRAALVVPVVLGLLTCAAGANSYIGYVRSLDDLASLVHLADGGDSELRAVPAAVPGGVRVADLSVPDPALRVPTGRTRVLLPPGYDDPRNAGRRYPVVYLVHGYPSGGPDDWLGPGGAAGTLQALSDTRAAAPMIVVAVDATAGSGTDWECLDVPGGPQLESYLTGTVPRAVDAAFRTLPDRGDRAIGGMSGGAFCALNLGLHHQDTYSVILATEPEATPDTPVLDGHPELVAANTPLDYLASTRLLRPLSVMLHAGVVARTDVDVAERLGRALASRGAAVALRVEPGEWHTWRTARLALPYLLTFAAEHFTGATPEPAPVTGGRTARAAPAGTPASPGSTRR